MNGIGSSYVTSGCWKATTLPRYSRGSEMSAFSLSKPSFGLHSCVDDHYSSSVNSKSLRGQLVLWALARDERSRGTGDHWAQLQKEAVDVRKTAGK